MARLTQESGKLELKFTDNLPADPGWQPYWVHWTDYENYSIVGGPSGRFLWILSRREKVSVRDASKMAKLVESFGYNLKEIVFNENKLE